MAIAVAVVALVVVEGILSVKVQVAVTVVGIVLVRVAAVVVAAVVAVQLLYVGNSQSTDRMYACVFGQALGPDCCFVVSIQLSEMKTIKLLIGGPYVT